MVEELLKFFVGEVDTQLLESVVVEDLKAGNIQDTNEVLSLLFCVQRLITLPHQPFEQAIEHAFGHGTHRVRDLVLVPTLGHKLVAYFDPGLQEVLVKFFMVGTQELSHTCTFLRTVCLSLLLSTSLFELHATHMHYSGNNLVDIVFLFLSETQYVEGLISQLTFFAIIHIRNCGLALGHIVIVVDVVGQGAYVFHSSNRAGHDLVEDVVGPLQRLLRNDTSLLQQICFNISAGQFTRCTEVDTDEFTES